MKKSEAIKEIIADYHNKLISQDFDLLDNKDIEICKALKIKIPENKTA